MRRLKEIEKVAYVRFASVYLEFEDVSEFMSELKTLVRARTVQRDGLKRMVESDGPQRWPGGIGAH